MVTILFLLLGNVWVARHLSREEAGLFLTLYNGISLIGLLGQLGLRTSVVRWIADSFARDLPGKARAAIVTTIRLTHYSLLLLVLLSLLTYVAIRALGFNAPLTTSQALLAAAWLGTQGVQFTLPEVFRGEHRHALAGFLGGTLANSLILLAFIATDWFSPNHSLGQVLVIVACAGLFNYVCVMSRLSRMLARLPANESWPMQDALRESLPVLGTQVSTGALLLIDTVLVGLLSGPVQAALYGTASRLTVLINLPLQMVASAISPQVVRDYANKDLDAIEDVSRLAATAAAIPGLVIALLFLFFGDSILRLFGEQYVEAHRILQILTIGQVVYILSGPTGTLLMLCGYQSSTLRLVSRIALLSCVAQAFAAYCFGAMGVATVVMLTVAVLAITQSVATKMFVGVFCHLRVSFR